MCYCWEERCRESENEVFTQASHSGQASALIPHRLLRGSSSGRTTALYKQFWLNGKALFYVIVSHIALASWVKQGNQERFFFSASYGLQKESSLKKSQNTLQANLLEVPLHGKACLNLAHHWKFCHLSILNITATLALKTLNHPWNSAAHSEKLNRVNI